MGLNQQSYMTTVDMITEANNEKKNATTFINKSKLNFGYFSSVERITNFIQKINSFYNL